MDGSQLLELVKRDPMLRVLPTAILTNPDVVADVSEHCPAGADAYIVKTAEYEQYVGSLGEALRLTGLATAPALS
jgi:hypothetical protein